MQRQHFGTKFGSNADHQTTMAPALSGNDVDKSPRKKTRRRFSFQMKAAILRDVKQKVSVDKLSIVN